MGITRVTATDRSFDGDLEVAVQKHDLTFFPYFVSIFCLRFGALPPTPVKLHLQK